MTELSEKVERSLARFERITQTIDEKQASAGSASSRNRDRTVAKYGRALTRGTMAFLLVAVLTIVIGLFVPIGMFGFMAAVGIAGALAIMVMITESSRADAPIDARKAVPADLGNAAMVERFDSFLFKSRRMLPPPAQRVVDRLAQDMGTLKQTLERVDPLEPAAQDARRLMSVHLPSLLERYQNVPSAYRREADAEGKTVDQRLTESLEAGRAALGDISERLAKQDLDAFQTQGRFIQSRYGEDKLGDPA